MAKKRNTYILIPIFLNLILLMGIPFFRDFSDGGIIAGRLAPLLVLGFAFPWFLYLIIGKIIRSISQESTRRREEKQNQGFV